MRATGFGLASLVAATTLIDVIAPASVPGILGPGATASADAIQCPATTPTQATFAPADGFASYVVPTGVRRMVAVVSSGSGGDAVFDFDREPSRDMLSRPGAGATVTSTITTTPGATLSIGVGRQGGLGTGGTSGGAVSGGGTDDLDFFGQGGGGGGSSAVAVAFAAPLVIAGGGGGAGFGGHDDAGPANASDGGDAVTASATGAAGSVFSGGDGVIAAADKTPGGPGEGGSTTDGAAGATNPGLASPFNTLTSTGGTSGAGGHAAGNAGGGGGGYAGGGAGGFGIYSGGGGAGSSYSASAYTIAPHQGDGSVSLTYQLPSVTSQADPALTTLTPGSFTVCAAGVPTVALQATGALPSGVTFTDNHDGTATISGTPASGSAGIYPILISADNGDGAATQDLTLTVDPASSHTDIEAAPASPVLGQSVTLTATVSGAADATAPTGSIGFSDDGQSLDSRCDAVTLVALAGVPTATCTVAAADLGSHLILATYGGDENYAASLGSVSYDVNPAPPPVTTPPAGPSSPAIVPPRISAAVSSTHAKTAAGWYRGAVTISFTCQVGSAPLATDCPPAVALSASGAGQSVTRTAAATDGGSASITVGDINIDLDPPHVRYRGVRNGATYRHPPRIRCVATDRLSGVASCTIFRHRERLHRIRFVVRATDDAGNHATAHGSYRLRRSA